MAVLMGGHKLSRETMRARPIKGGTRKCSWCDKPRASSSSYCSEHRNEYFRQRRVSTKSDAAELKANLARKGIAV